MFTKFEIDVNCGGRRHPGDHAVRFFFPSDVTRPSRKNCKNSILYISHKIAKSLRWITKDRVEFYWDAESKKVGIKRSASGIAAICSGNNKGRMSQHHIHVNRQVAETIAKAWVGDRDGGYSVIASHEIIDDMLVLSFDRIA